MNKILLCVAAVFCFALQSCNDDRDDLLSELGSLNDRVEQLQNTVVKDLNEDISALKRLLDSKTVIVGTTPTDKGYVLELSDGTKIEITLGGKVPAQVPVLGIDAEGYWIYRVGEGEFQRLIVDGKPVSAYPTNDSGEHATEGVTPLVRVDANGFWEVSVDGGNTYNRILVDGKPVTAFGDKGEIEYSGFFRSVTYDEKNHQLKIELLTGQTLTLPVEDTFGIEIKALAEGENFLLGEVRRFEVKQTAVKEAMIKAPKGWKAVLGETELTVTAPATFSGEEFPVEIEVVAVSEKGYLKKAVVKATLINKPVEELGCEAWRKFKTGASDNVLLDYSYAGYRHAEEAPADGMDWGYTVYNVCDYGADPTGKTSSREALEKLLYELKLSGTTPAGKNQANANARAVIYFPEGRFILHNDDDNTADGGPEATIFDSKGNNASHEIFIRGGNLVIKGAGRGKTTLVMDTPNLPQTPKVMYSSPTMINIKHNSSHLTTKLADVTGGAAKGSFAVSVSTTAGISAGDWVCLYLKNNDPELIAEELAPFAVEPQMKHLIKDGVIVEDFHQVKAVNGNTLIFHEPIMHAVDPRWRWTIQKYPHYENVGVEDLTFEGHANPNFVHHSSWFDDGAYKPLQMMRLTNSWLRRVDFVNISEAATISFSANCSAYDINITGVRGHSGVRAASSSRIFIGKVLENGRGLVADHSPQEGAMMDNVGQYHASGVSNTALGTVLWNNVWGVDSFFESHSRQPRATLIDRCRGGFTQSRFGGAMENVPNHLADMTFWNFDATNLTHFTNNIPFKWWMSRAEGEYYWKNLPPIIVGMHGAASSLEFDPTQLKYIEKQGEAVYPQSLFEAQLEARLGYVPAWLNALK